MRQSLDKQQILEEQVKVLYGGMPASVIGTVFIALLISIITIQSESIDISLWVGFIIGIALIRGLDSHLFFKTKTDRKNSLQDMRRFLAGSTLAAAAWGLLVWQIFPISSPEYRAVVVFILSGVTSFATMTLSYHYGAITSYLLVATFPLAVRIYQDDSRLQAIFLTLVLLFLVFQLLGARRINRNYIENIQLRNEAHQKEIELRNQQYALDQHAIVSIANMRGEITHANDKFLEVSGYSRKDVLGQDHRLVNSGYHTREFFREMWRTIAHGHVWRGEIKNKSADGREYWVDSTIVPFLNERGKPYQYISMRTDITPMKVLQRRILRDRNDALVRAQVAAILQEQSSLQIRLREALAAIASLDDAKEAAKIGLFLLDDDQQTQSLYIAYGDFPEDTQAVRGCQILQTCLSPESPPPFELLVEDGCPHASADNDHGHYVVPLYRRDLILGMLFIFTRKQPSREQSRLDTLNFIGDMIGLAIANERLKEEMEQARANAEAMAQAKSDFLANMSHEIRTPMNGVLGMLDLLAEMPLDRKAQSFVDVAQNSAEMLLTVINDILDLSKIESGKLAIEKIPFSLRKSVEDVAVLLMRQATQKNLTLSCLIDPDLPYELEGDVMRLQQILTNLISNAIKFTPHGEVTLHVSQVETDVAYHMSLLRFEVKDTGIGIPEEKQTQLFDAFTQADTSTSRQFGGTGLGLAISKHLAEMMDGQIGVHSIEGQGSTFWIEIPFQVLQNSDRVTQGPSYDELSELRVLIVEPHTTQRKILKTYLQHQNCQASCVTDVAVAEYALQEAIDARCPFDVMILSPDSEDPNAERLCALMDRFPSVSVLLLSDMTRPDHADAAQDIPRLAKLPRLSKPVRQEALYETLLATQVDTTQSTVHLTKRVEGALQGHLLLVDDNPVNQQVGHEMLAQFGLQAEVANNGQEAVDQVMQAQLSGNPFDLILLDCQMPIMDGYTASLKIRGWETRSAFARTPIIALTANAMQGDREKCLAAGMDDYLSKPYTQEQLRERLIQWLPAMTERQAEKEQAPAETQCEQAEAFKESVTNADMIDVDRFEETRTMMGEQMADMLDAFFASAEESIEAMQTCLAENDFATLRHHAHSLKGSCGTLGIHALHIACKGAEERCRLGETDNMQDEVRTITALFDASREAVLERMATPA